MFPTARSLTAASLIVSAAIAAPCIAFPPLRDQAGDPWGQPTSRIPAACEEASPVIQLAILLDTSGSMQGLINQARARIWDVVNDLNKAQRNGRRARLEVSLYQYGSDRLPSCEGFLTLVQPFTTDLDLLSERLFSLEIDGQAEYCGWAIQSALSQLSWDSTPISRPLADQPLRVMVIAGNEPFTQGPVSYREAARTAPGRGVIINTVYCGNSEEGYGCGWADGARLGRGAYLSIDHNRAVPVVRCPQDDEIFRLNARLNETYVPFGAHGDEFKDRQVAQDQANRALSPAGAVARATTKASSAYANSHWDLVDAVREKKADIDTVKTESLPPSMRSMTIDERKQEIDRLNAERDQLKDRIRTLAAERERFLTEQRAHEPRGDTLDSAMIRAMREQARRLGFRFE